MINVKKGEKFIVIKDFPTVALTSLGKPYTGSEECVIPKGTIVISQNTSPNNAQGFSVIPNS